jgi:hypothetical protein
MRIFIAVIVVSATAAAWCASTTRPTKNVAPAAKQTSTVDAEATLSKLLAPRPEEPPIQPLPAFLPDTTPDVRVAPTPGPMGALIPEGTLIFDRMGRLEKTPDGQQEFRFESDGVSMQDAPMLLLPNQNLMGMEDNLKRNGGHVRFRISGMVTEYGSRNYVLIQKYIAANVQVVPREKKE